MEIVTAWHGDNIRRAGEHIVAADRAIAVCCSLDAAVGGGKLDGDTDVAFLEISS